METVWREVGITMAFQFRYERRSGPLVFLHQFGHRRALLVWNCCHDHHSTADLTTGHCQVNSNQIDKLRAFDLFIALGTIKTTVTTKTKNRAGNWSTVMFSGHLIILNYLPPLSAVVFKFYAWPSSAYVRWSLSTTIFIWPIQCAQNSKCSSLGLFGCVPGFSSNADDCCDFPIRLSGFDCRLPFCKVVQDDEWQRMEKNILFGELCLEIRYIKLTNSLFPIDRLLCFTPQSFLRFALSSMFSFGPNTAAKSYHWLPCCACCVSGSSSLSLSYFWATISGTAKLNTSTPSAPIRSVDRYPSKCGTGTRFCGKLISWIK